MSIVPVSNVPAQIVLEPQPVQALPLAHAVGVAGSYAQGGPNLTQQAAPTYQVLRNGAGLPPSADPTFVLPVNGQGFMQLYNALQAIAVEHVYPAPIFSFSA